MDTPTRRQIIELLKRDGAQDAAALASELGVSAMAVRQHLYALAAEGVVASTADPNGVGRPAKQWHLTPAADVFFPHGYAELTAELLSSMAHAFGQSGLDKIIDIRLRDQIDAYRDRMAKDRTVARRVRRLVEIRNAEGYMAAAMKDGDGFLLVENHCPICAAARACTGLCKAELELFETVLGDGVTVERTDHILAGARRCAYRITKAGSRAA
ncbi:MAG: transcriptional regulator [Alphaproteobacteria bacterium]|nr:transcriptional regulator [Alphaproteobacteria bacterium]